MYLIYGNYQITSLDLGFEGTIKIWVLRSGNYIDSFEDSYYFASTSQHGSFIKTIPMDEDNQNFQFSHRTNSDVSTTLRLEVFVRPVYFFEF
jgi:hypothetical protein